MSTDRSIELIDDELESESWLLAFMLLFIDGWEVFEGSFSAVGASRPCGYRPFFSALWRPLGLEPCPPVVVRVHHPEWACTWPTVALWSLLVVELLSIVGSGKLVGQNGHFNLGWGPLAFWLALGLLLGCAWGFPAMTEVWGRVRGKNPDFGLIAGPVQKDLE